MKILSARCVAVIALSVAACMPRPKVVSAVETKDSAGAPHVVDAEADSTHAYRSESLRSIMRELDRLSAQEIAARLAPGAQSSRNALAAAAAQLANTADTLAQTNERIELTPTERYRFKDYAIRLYRDAHAIDVQARRADFAAARASFQSLNETCILCHSLTRNPPLKEFQQ